MLTHSVSRLLRWPYHYFQPLDEVHEVVVVAAATEQGRAKDALATSPTS